MEDSRVFFPMVGEPFPTRDTEGIYLPPDAVGTYVQLARFKENGSPGELEVRTYRVMADYCLKQVVRLEDAKDQASA